MSHNDHKRRKGNHYHHLEATSRDSCLYKPAALYKGLTSPLAGVAIVNACLFGVYGFLLSNQLKQPDDIPTIGQIFWAGAGSGAINTIVSCPVELAKIRLQMQKEATTQHRYRGSLDCLRQIYGKGGLRACFLGFNSTIIREVPSYGAYFASYEAFCRAFAENGDVASLSGPRLMVAGGLAGIAGWISTYPIGTICLRKRRSRSNLPE